MEDVEPLGPRRLAEIVVKHCYRDEGLLQARRGLAELDERLGRLAGGRRPDAAPAEREKPLHLAEVVAKACPGTASGVVVCDQSTIETR